MSDWRELVDLPNQAAAICTKCYLLEHGGTDETVKSSFMLILADADPDEKPPFPIWVASVDRVRAIIATMAPNAKLFPKVGASESAEALLAQLGGESVH